ncbi:MAG TPA: AAA domain-containing protein [Tepidisphaeraceae bacterium]|nr:AAA domain-containing protein [Tepidisphaeraceae bacterium]
MESSDNRILKKLLDRLLASLVNGPSLNCRPHSSRQRVDLAQLVKLKDQSPEQILRGLLGPDRQAKIAARARPIRQPNKSPAPPIENNGQENADSDGDLSPQEKADRQAFAEQQSVLGKLRSIAEDARTYENDTGVHVLQIGFPLLSMPPGKAGTFGLSRRILAPLAFVSLSMTIKAGPAPTVVLECRNQGADLIVPNVALLSWLQQQTGQDVGELFDDPTGQKPWNEIVAIARRVCELAHVELPGMFLSDEVPADFPLSVSPRSDAEESPVPTVIAAAVLGLYPMTNQGLLRDMEALADGEPIAGPIESFLSLDASLEPPPIDPADGENTAAPKQSRQFASERLVAHADPCQARAVRLARTCRGLVVHGPPGTGKSQTITNVIGDHLARGQRVLFVCDKRTALDVVMNRLAGMGLDSLCAIVHDPQRDQRELYKSIREQLESLADLKTDASADGQLASIDAELQSLHAELTTYHAALMHRPDKDALSFHELMGRWLEAPGSTVEFDNKLLEQADHRLVDSHARALTEIADRAAKIGYATNPWTAAAGIPLEQYLTTPIEQLRSEIGKILEACKEADAQADPFMPPIPPDRDLSALAAARVDIAERIELVRSAVPAELRAKWATVPATVVLQSRQAIAEADGTISAVRQAPLERELIATVRDALPTLGQIAQQNAALDAYIECSHHFLGFLAFGKKSAAAKVLAVYGLQPSPANVRRISAFLAALKARRLLGDLLAHLAPESALPALPADEMMLAAVEAHQTLFDFLLALHADPNLDDVHEPVLLAAVREKAPDEFLRGLRATPARVQTIQHLHPLLAHPLFDEPVRQLLLATAQAAQPMADIVGPLAERFETLENVLRIREGLRALPGPLQAAMTAIVRQNVPGESALAVLRKASDANEIVRRLRANRLLMTADGQQLHGIFARYQQLDATKKQLTRQAILHHWGSKQKEQLLAGTGTRLNGQGADLRRRLTIRGERAMRLRQVIRVGQSIEGGDPLYNLRPVWMASPETVAQIFPRSPLFDVVIFDEASQCRLEEAMPVLLRAQRVVIAGDPRQLPPTRFFESAIAASEEEEIESDQQLFESQQGEIEDLLSAALNLSIEECYLDVHYRSRNSDLIEFSNEQFYHSRLQAIPGHPRNRTRFAPLTLYACNGVYEKRANAAEARKVSQIVRDLLKRAEPPSIGIACFNITQRDKIVEALEELASEDAEFAKALAAARERRTNSAFDGLFVKNLENVQGDERDHLIISTTYGPDARGKFYRRFGPLGTAGGGRRLNVLVTRARDEVHLVTSIPQVVYRNLPPIPPGQTPGGAWLLFSYLVYAERLAEIYELNHRLLEQEQSAEEPVVNVRKSKFPSNFASQFAQRLHAEHRMGSDVHWGNDGFCIDLALHHPQRPEDVTVGVLCDLNRFAQAADPVEWEIFRTAVLEAQGWTFSRVWTPHFFRDRVGVTGGVLKDAQTVAAASDDPQAIRTISSKTD